MILLDTNILSELMKARPEPGVLQWIDAQVTATTFITSITEAELRYGAAILPAGKRQVELIAAIDRVLSEDFPGRILPFDSSAAVAYAVLATKRRQSGRPIGQSDAQIAAIAKSRSASLATRNVKDFEGCGIHLVNPWEIPAK